MAIVDSQQDVRLDLRVVPYGDSAMLAQALGANAEQRWRSIHQLGAALTASRPGGVYDLIATFDSLLVEFDNRLTTHSQMEPFIRQAWADLGVQEVKPDSRIFHIPVVFGHEYGPDLVDVASELGLPPEDVVRLHCETDFVVRFFGAPLGAPQLDGSALPAPVTRCREPRTKVPPGSLSIAGLQACIYPVLTPGGWRIIGRTPLRVIDVNRRPMAAYAPGDVFRFYPITPDKWVHYDQVLLGEVDD
jgi:KipI family sensor histidine kinase inhibitor